MNWLSTVLVFGYISVFSFMSVSLLSSCDKKAPIPNPDYVGQVIENETGEPVEGAIALATWMAPARPPGAIFEGGMYKYTRIEEVLSDKEGKIYIKDFWKDAHHLSGGPYKDSDEYFLGPMLTVYKPGYVCWNFCDIFLPSKEYKELLDKYAGSDNGIRILALGQPSKEDDQVGKAILRRDFGYNQRNIRLKKWVDDKNNHVRHFSFIETYLPEDKMTDTEWKQLNYKRLLHSAFDEAELSFIVEEMDEIRESRLKGKTKKMPIERR